MIKVIVFAIFILSTSALRDVCILGASASGMSVATFLKDKGYNPLVIEKAPYIGGHCNTFYFNPPAPGLPNWIDIGVQVYVNTAFLNSIGLGVWDLDSIAFASRFTQYGVVNIDFTKPTTLLSADFKRNITYGIVNTAPTPEFVLALETLFYIGYQYPWLNTGEYPDPIPPELLVPFSDFIVEWGLEPLNDIILRELVFGGGMGSYQNLTAVYALMYLSPASLLFITTPNVTFSPIGGCIQIYEGIERYIGSENLLVDTNTILAIRPNTESHSPIALLLNQAGIFRVEECERLIVAFPPVFPDIDFLIPDLLEAELFVDAVPRYYFTAEINVTGYLNSLPGYSLINVDLTQPFNNCVLPALLAVQRGLPYGPSVTGISSDVPISDQEAQEILVRGLGKIPNDLAATATLLNFRSHNRFQSHFNLKALTKTPGPYTRLKNLQGHRKTYWLSVLGRFAVSTMMWEQSYDLVSEYF